MSKEEMAKAYADGFVDKHYSEIAYDAFLCGYGAKCDAEKDFALTWEDIRTIYSLLDETARLLWFQNKKFTDKELCEETLRKFNKAKEEQK